MLTCAPSIFPPIRTSSSSIWGCACALSPASKHCSASVRRSTRRVPDGLTNNIIFRLYPLHLGMRWYWRDFGSMERWSRSEPHRQWWQRFMRDSGGTGFWHEVYLMRGGMEGVYADLNLPPLGFQGFAPPLPAHGGMFSARQRLRLAGETPTQPSGVAE